MFFKYDDYQIEIKNLEFNRKYLDGYLYSIKFEKIDDKLVLKKLHFYGYVNNDIIEKYELFRSLGLNLIE